MEIGIGEISLIILATASGTFLIMRRICQFRLDKAQKSVLVDTLTGLGSPKAFESDIKSAVNLARKESQPLSLILFDLDGFKALNTNHGYTSADLVLKEIGRRLNSDIRNTDSNYRYHSKGDEFAVIAQNTDYAGAVRAGQRKHLIVTSLPYSINTQQLQVGITWNVTELNSGESQEEWITRSEKELLSKKSH